MTTNETHLIATAALAMYREFAVSSHRLCNAFSVVVDAIDLDYLPAEVVADVVLGHRSLPDALDAAAAVLSSCADDGRARQLSTAAAEIRSATA